MMTVDDVRSSVELDLCDNELDADAAEALSQYLDSGSVVGGGGGGASGGATLAERKAGRRVAACALRALKLSFNANLFVRQAGI